MERRPRGPLAWTTAVTLVVSMAVAGLSPQAAPVADLDQEQPAIQAIDGGDTLGGPSHQKVAQIVDVGIAGELWFVELPIKCFGDSTLTIEIQNVVTIPGPLTMPSGTVLASASIAAADLPAADTSGFRLFDIAATPTFNVKQRFAIVMTATGPGALDSCLIRHAPAGDTYAGGDGWFVNDGQMSPWNPGGWLCKCDAGPGAAFDYPFRTYMKAPAPPAEADLSIAMTLFDLENPGATNTFSATAQMYQLTVSNVGPADATAVTVVDTLPANVTVLLMPAGCTETSGTVTCTESLLSAGGQTFFNIAFRFDKAGSYTNSASVSASEPDPDTTDNTATLTTQVHPTADLAWTLVGTAEGPIYDPGDTATYTITITNSGPDPAGDVALVQTIPAGSTFVSVSSPDTTLCGQNGTNVGEYGCRFSAIPVGALRSMTVTFTVPSTPDAYASTWLMAHVQVAGSPIYDFPDNSTVDHVVWVVSETRQQTVAAGGSASTDSESDGATSSDPVETTVTSPNAGSLTITERAQTGSASTSWTMLGAEVVISAPAATASDPLRLTFLIDSALVDKLSGPGTPVEIFRNYGATAIGDCALTAQDPPQAVLPISPDPCVLSRTTLADGDLEIVVLTSQASVWTFGSRDPLSFAGFEEPLVEGTNLVNAGRAVPIKFSLGGFQGMDVLVSGTPSSRAVACDGSPSNEVLEVGETLGGGLRYDESTDTYSIRWDTEPGWAGTCRELVLQLADGSRRTALFRFR